MLEQSNILLTVVFFELVTWRPVSEPSSFISNLNATTCRLPYDSISWF